MVFYTLSDVIPIFYNPLRFSPFLLQDFLLSFLFFNNIQSDDTDAHNFNKKKDLLQDKHKRLFKK